MRKGIVFMDMIGDKRDVCTYTVWYDKNLYKHVKIEDWPGQKYLDLYHRRHKESPQWFHRPMCIVKTKA